MLTTHSFPLTRRRALFIGATLLAAGLLPAEGARANAQVQRWSGVALGADAAIDLAGLSAGEAEPVFADVEAEIARLERIFSLYRTDSELMRLNSEGMLNEPSPEFLEVLSLSFSIHRATGGLFDPTVQPLFDLYARHFSAENADPDGPSRERLEEALGKVGLEGVTFDAKQIRFARPGMALTFNGIAQGYITDRIGALLTARGFGNMLLDIGEVRGFGRGRDGAGWQVRIEEITRPRFLSNQAIATSSPLGTVLDPAGRFGHIFDPQHGFVRGALRQISVIAGSAAVADGLSTGLAVSRKPPGDFLAYPAGSGQRVEIVKLA